MSAGGVRTRPGPGREEAELMATKKKKKKSCLAQETLNLVLWFWRRCDRRGLVPAARPASSAPGGGTACGVSTEAPGRPPQPAPATPAAGAPGAAVPQPLRAVTSVLPSPAPPAPGPGSHRITELSHRAVPGCCGVSAAAVHSLTGGAERPSGTHLSPAPVGEQLLHSHIKGSVHFPWHQWACSHWRS